MSSGLGKPRSDRGSCVLISCSLHSSSTYLKLTKRLLISSKSHASHRVRVFLSRFMYSLEINEIYKRRSWAQSLDVVTNARWREVRWNERHVKAFTVLTRICRTGVTNVVLADTKSPAKTMYVARGPVQKITLGRSTSSNYRISLLKELKVNEQNFYFISLYQTGSPSH